MSEHDGGLKPLVEVRELCRPVCDTCNEKEATHYVALDLPAAGMGTSLGDYCKACARALVKRLSRTVYFDRGRM